MDEREDEGMPSEIGGYYSILYNYTYSSIS
jgi:hypothetical protein